jgi:transposase
MHDVDSIRAKFDVLRPFLDERRRRLWTAAEARVLGRGGITAVAIATGLQRATIRVGLRELHAGLTANTEASPATRGEHRVRAAGAGRKSLTAHDPALLHDLEALVEPVTRGDPMSPLRWTCTSTRQLAAELVRQGHQVSHQTVAELLHALDYSLQATRKTKERADHPDRQVSLVAMEATGVYWKAPYYALEKRFEGWLCNAQLGRWGRAAVAVQVPSQGRP